MSEDTQLKRVTLLLTCIEGDECVVAFEPDGAVHKLSTEDAFHVEIEGPGSGTVEIGYVSDGITVVAWSDASLRVTNRAGELVPT